MGKARVASFSVSIDGFGAGPDQDLAHPLGRGGPALHDWGFATRTFHRALGKEGGSTDVDDDFARGGLANIGAFVIGRNMFGPVRGPWLDDHWKGWGGETPPFNVPVFRVDAPPAIFDRDAGRHDVAFRDRGNRSGVAARPGRGRQPRRVGGGPNIIRQCVRARLVDKLHLAIAPVILGAGEHVFNGIDLASLGYTCIRHAATPKAMQEVLGRRVLEC